MLANGRHNWTAGSNGMMDMRHSTKFAAIAVTMLASWMPPVGTVRAAEPVGRYSMQPVPGGVLRLDTQSGAVSMCTSREGGRIRCEPVEDDRGLQAEVQRLTEENKRLRDDVKRLEELAGLGDGKGTRPGGPTGPQFQLPTEEDVDKALSYLDRMIRKFRDKMQELEKSEPKGKPL